MITHKTAGGGVRGLDVMGFHVTDEAASEYICVFSGKLISEHHPEENVGRFSEFRFRDQYQAYMFW